VSGPIRRHLLEQTPDSLGAFAIEHGLPRHFASQVLRWIFGRGVLDPERMTDLSRAQRDLLIESTIALRGTVRERQLATDGTEKMLLGWDVAPAAGTPDAVGEGATMSLPLAHAPGARAAEERRTECVMIPADRRRTACVSSQVGCPVGCAFCASGLGGLEGNLDPGQIVEQVWRLSSMPGPDGAPPQRISHVVFMGMGEPLANFGAVTNAIRTLNAPWGLGISARRITVSTVGLPQAIRRLCTFEIPVTLALSLHAPNDELRRRIIPWAEYSTIDELLDACDEWFRRTGREITLEYILLGDFNDRPEHARELADVASRLRANVNLIRYNEVRGLPFRRPSTDDVLRFQEVLRRRHVNVHIRASRGRDIAAACGQLRHETRAR